MPHYTFPQKVLFKHCDPAGIVFYPRYFEMINDAVEGVFCDLLDWPFEVSHRTGALPTVTFEIAFTAPSRHGDQLALEIDFQKIGRTSLTLNITTVCKEQTRFTAVQKLVCVNEHGRPAAWPETVREKVKTILESRT